MGDLLDAAVLDPLVEQPQLQDAGRWRVRAARSALARDHDALAALAGVLAPFQQWYLGVFLLESPETHEVAATMPPPLYARLPHIASSRSA